MKYETIRGLKKYAEERIPTGGFLRAVLENDLVGAFGRADIENTADMEEIVSYVYNEMPAACHGSPEKVRLWLNPTKAETTMEQALDKTGLPLTEAEK